MAAAPKPAPVTTNLKRKGSRWQTLPPPGGENGEDINVDDSKYSLLLFLRDLDADETRWKEFATVLQDAPGALDENSPAFKFAQAVTSAQHIDHDYLDADHGPATKKRRLDLRGNRAAATTLAEYDQVIRLARTFWTNPDDLGDILGELYERNTGQSPSDEIYSLDNIFHMARSWGEVRYRFMNHSLRDDYTSGPKYNAGRQLAKGNAANAIVHESNVLLDAQMVEFRSAKNIGYTATDRDIFEELYILTPEDGRRLVEYSSANSGLRVGLPQVFTFVAQFINATIDWRVAVLEASRKQAMSSQAFRNARNQAQKQNVLEGRHQGNEGNLYSVDRPYGADLIPSVKLMLQEAKDHNAVTRASYDRFETAVRTITTEVKRSPMNRAAASYHFTRSVNAFPGAVLSRPTGTAIITIRPTPTPRGRGR
ncbi:hypothetical protein F4678DRAFT_441556 [Xylaria arbuscula]|nr:hypothetical protein F4678DRAFT_441556 [Xylaria arbuscula]